MHRLGLGAALLSLAVSVVVFPWLPSLVPTHFDLAGHPDGFSSRAFGAFLLPAISLVACVLVRRTTNPGASITVALVAWFLLGMHVLVLHAALAGGGLGGAMWVLCGAFFVAMGLVLPRVRRNRWVGVRTPWAMRSPENWARTQRVGGQAMIASGAFVLLSACGTGPLVLAVRALAIVGASVVPIAYSWWSSRRLST
jgi:uncharacterized membrane protein